MKNVIITIDGPSGTGKSTIARILADKLGYTFLDSGALYRACALAVDQLGADIDNDAICKEIISNIKIDLDHDRVFLNGTDVSESIRTPHVSALSSRIAVLPSVRRLLLKLQRDFAQKTSLVAEGRDTGSVIFPQADVKIYLDATSQARAQRRFLELAAKGAAPSYTQVLNDIEERDHRDRARTCAPLVVPDHAVVV
ncbi:MAG TPA: (d)CMP kinase, partial [Deltaproteobacteria bacterium]|nr:(d)CMP kinase [Deltaproteobacteria bacterium]